MLKDLQEILARCVTSEDPEAVLRAGLEDGRLGQSERALLQAIDGDGLRLTGLLVQKLRFERLLGGDPRARSEWQSDETAFTERFRHYTKTVPPSAVFPGEEARLFRDFE